jgi:hypothetical protein
MYAAGADTTVSTLGTFVLGMLANPDAQRNAQAEIDAVVGKGQLPDFTDEPSLPYTTAIVKEALRWKNVAPVGPSLLLFRSCRRFMWESGIPHFLAVEDEYRGYRIPAGSIVICNTWFVFSAFIPPCVFFIPTRVRAILHDEVCSGFLVAYHSNLA